MPKKHNLKFSPGPAIKSIWKKWKLPIILSSISATFVGAVISPFIIFQDEFKLDSYINDHRNIELNGSEYMLVDAHEIQTKDSQSNTYTLNFRTGELYADYWSGEDQRVLLSEFNNSVLLQDSWQAGIEMAQKILESDKIFRDGDISTQADDEDYIDLVDDARAFLETYGSLERAPGSQNRPETAGNSNNNDPSNEDKPPQPDETMEQELEPTTEGTDISHGSTMKAQNPMIPS